MSNDLKTAAVLLGRKGGRSRSEAKIAAVRENVKKAKAAPHRMWLVTRPGPDSKFADVCWECNWIDLGHAFRSGLDGSEVVGLYHAKAQAHAVAQSLLDMRDGRLPADQIAT